MPRSWICGAIVQATIDSDLPPMLAALPRIRNTFDCLNHPGNASAGGRDKPLENFLKKILKSGSSHADTTCSRAPRTFVSEMERRDFV